MVRGIWGCIPWNETLTFSVTLGKRPNDDQRTVLVTTGETVDNLGRRRLVSQEVSSSWRNPIKRKFDQWINIFRGSRGGEEDEIPNKMGFMLSTQNVEQTMRTKCICGKKCKNLRGLRIHQARMRCLEKESVTLHRTTTWWDTGGARPCFTKQSSVSTCLSLNPLTELRNSV